MKIHKNNTRRWHTHLTISQSLFRSIS